MVDQLTTVACALEQGTQILDESEKTGEPQNSPTLPPLDIWSAKYPDGGGRAWLVVFGAACANFSTCVLLRAAFGYVNAWGVFQSFYSENLLKGSSPSNIAWIGSVQYSLIFIPGLVSGHYFDKGHFKIPFLVASVVLITATFLVGQCTQYWHFLLCQGFATGMSAGILFAPVAAVIGHWFKERRGMAMGFVACGSSIGGTLFPIVARNLIPRVGFPWTLRIIGFILLCSLGCANLTVRRRLPAKHVPGGLLNPTAFKNPAYTFYCISGVVAFFGLYTVLTYIDVSATSVGISPDFSFYLISIANGASLFGRLTAGFAADKLGAVNVVAPMSAIAAIMTYVWPLARSKGSFVAIAILYGFSSGAYVSSFTLPMYHLGDIADVGRRSGMAMTLCAVGAIVGPPISGAIGTASGGYSAVGYYAGSMILAAIVLMLITRHLVLGKLGGKF
ncbi:MFS general substrate transporter [Mycena albidolilacea]|uniref:MFS general substrate transporter n=1 Tax=Mycena albidolilacea TaxID=1033008 RepID=A0AAD7A7C3_9AGAR|nr:MFS general substrate transporter [Mycena albidolilacea]